MSVNSVYQVSESVPNVCKQDVNVMPDSWSCYFGASLAQFLKLRNSLKTIFKNAFRSRHFLAFFCRRMLRSQDIPLFACTLLVRYFTDQLGIRLPPWGTIRLYFLYKLFIWNIVCMFLCRYLYVFIKKK